MSEVYTHSSITYFSYLYLLHHIDDTVGCIVDGFRLSHFANIWVGVRVDSRHGELVSVRPTQVSDGWLQVGATGQQVPSSQEKHFANVINQNLRLVMKRFQERLNDELLHPSAFNSKQSNLLLIR